MQNRLTFLAFIFLATFYDSRIDCTMCLCHKQIQTSDTVTGLTAMMQPTAHTSIGLE